VTNPFHIPGLDDNPIKPLCPWDEDTPEHEKYYAPIDHTQDAYDRFTESMANPHAVRRNGRLVLVAGQSGCGKTSLMNRCVNWLRAYMKTQHKVRVAIVDLTTASSVTDTVDERMVEVSRRLAQEVTMENLVSADNHAMINQNRESCADLLPLLEKRLNDKLVLAVLLPPIELLVNADAVAREIGEYSRLVRGKIVFFVEVTLADDQVSRLAAVKAPAAREPMILHVQPLKDGDGVVFSDIRLSLHKESGGFPQMTDDAKKKLSENKSLSVRSLQKHLYGMYEERRTKNDRYTASDTVSFQDITDYLYKISDLR
jgi:archaellum biogenesis ATPase FlaH